MLGRVSVAKPRRQAAMDVCDSPGLVSRDLIAQCEMKCHVKKGIHLAALGREIRREGLVAGFQPRGIFRMLSDHGGELRLERLERCTGAVFSPCLKIEAAQLLAILS